MPTLRNYCKMIENLFSLFLSMAQVSLVSDLFCLCPDQSSPILIPYFIQGSLRSLLKCHLLREVFLDHAGDSVSALIEGGDR